MSSTESLSSYADAIDISSTCNGTADSNVKLKKDNSNSNKDVGKSFDSEKKLSELERTNSENISENNDIGKDDEFSDALNSTEETYVCSLDEATQKKALEELGEDPLTRMKHVNDLKEWLGEQKDVTANTDTSVLLMFLRAAKFNQEKARQKILGMLTMGRERPSWFKDINTTADDITAVYNDLYVIPLPKPDVDGAKIVLYRMGSFDPSGARYTKSSIMKAFGGLFIHLMREEENQVNGFVYVIDAGEFNTRQQLFWTPNDLRTIARMWQKALPARFKRFHFIRMGFTFDIILKLLMPFLSAKFKERIMIHGNDLNELRKHIPCELLPDEYLPKDYQGPSAGPMPQIVEILKDDISKPEVKDFIGSMTSNDFSIQIENGKSRWSWLRPWVRPQ